MSVQFGHLRLVDPPAAQEQAAGLGVPAAPAGPPTAATPAVTADVIPASPPAEVSEQVNAALQRAGDLFAENRELHFAKDPSSGRVVVEVRDLDGNVLRTIPPSEALDIMGGASV